MSALPSISAELPWQRDLWSHLLDRLNNQQLHHAILLCGVPHVGKKHFAMAFARFLLCHQPEAGHNCGKCHACELSRSGNHGDFKWVAPEPPSRVIKVDQVRALVDFTNNTAGLGRRKLIVLSPADSMNIQAANALLKSLEEPSADTYFILVCDRLHGLPATIRSRCQIVKMYMPNVTDAITWLDHLTGARLDSEKALDLARGQIMLAAQLYERAQMESATAIRDALGALGSGRGSVQALESLMAGEPLDELLIHLHRFLHDRINAMDSAALCSPCGRSTFSLLDEVVRLQRIVFSGANPNRQLLVDTLSLRFDSAL